MIQSEKKWQQYTESLISVLGLKGQPVSITYTDEEIKPTIETGIHACVAILKARNGEIIRLSKIRCACPGARWHLGLAKKREHLEKNLVEREKLWATVMIAKQSIGNTHKIAPPPYELANYVVFSPMNKAELRPDLVTILCNPGQASRLVFLADYHGNAVKPEVLGSLCWSAITYPLITGNLNVTVGDPTARRNHGYDDNELLVSIPYRMIPNIMEAMEHSTAGKGKMTPLLEKVSREQ